MMLQDTDGQVVEAHSASAGLDYPGVGPQIAALAAAGRLEVEAATDDQAFEGMRWLSRTEGILPALESAHAVAFARRVARELGPDDVLLLNLSGRGDKDVQTVEKWLRG